MTPDDYEFYNQFYRKYARLIVFYAKQYTTVPADYEDLAQDVVLRLMQNVPSLRAIADSPGRTAYYICLVVRSAFIDSHRVKHDVYFNPYPEDILETLIEGQYADQRMPVDSSYWDVQLLKERLPERDWEILEGKYIAGYTDAELAKRIGCSKNSIRMLLTRAKKKARVILFGNKNNGGESNEQ